MTNLSNTPSPIARAATLGTSSGVAFLIIDLVVRALNVPQAYAQELVGILTLVTPAAHRYLATQRKYGNGRLGFWLRDFFGTPAS